MPGRTVTDCIRHSLSREIPGGLVGDGYSSAIRTLVLPAQPARGFSDIELQAYQLRHVPEGKERPHANAVEGTIPWVD